MNIALNVALLNKFPQYFCREHNRLVIIWCVKSRRQDSKKDSTAGEALGAGFVVLWYHGCFTNVFSSGLKSFCFAKK